MAIIYGEAHCLPSGYTAEQVGLLKARKEEDRQAARVRQEEDKGFGGSSGMSIEAKLVKATQEYDYEAARELNYKKIAIGLVIVVGLETVLLVRRFLK